MGYVGLLAIAVSTVAIIALISTIPPVEADQPFIGEIRYFPFNFAPRGWAFCNGTLLPIGGNSALFAILGTTYGGDGRTSFALPNMQGRMPLHSGVGAGPGLSDYRLGQTEGSETVTLTANQIPSHNHQLVGQITAQLKAANAPGNTVLADGDSLGLSFARLYSTQTPSSAMHAGSIMISGSTENTGGDQSHNNMPPYLAINCNIALVGEFPSRS